MRFIYANEEFLKIYPITRKSQFHLDRLLFDHPNFLFGGCLNCTNAY